MNMRARAVSGLDGTLPTNFLPAALPVLQGQMETPFTLCQTATDGSLTTLLIAADQLLSSLDEVAEDAFLLSGAQHTRASAPETQEQDGNADSGPTIGIMDSGIAFWNPRFGTDHLQFSALGFLSLGGVTTLGKAEIAALSDLAREQGAPAVQTKMAQDHPQSVWGGEGHSRLIPPDGTSHGTAMSALAAQDAQSGTKLIGLELPAVAVTDSTGDTLRSILPFAIRSLISMAGDQSGPLVIVLPFAFLGGPRGASGALTHVLDSLPASKRDKLTIVVPTGNHREDQAHAVLSEATGPLQMRMMPDDHSSNTVELLIEGASPTLALSNPNGATAKMSVQPGVQVLELDNVVIGAIWTSQTDTGSLKSYRSRLTLAPTASRAADAILCPAGLWSLHAAGADDVRAWILRDDNILQARGAPTKRQAQFEDAQYTRYYAGAVFEAPADLPDSTIKRQGTASVLAVDSVHAPEVIAVTAKWRPNHVGTGGGDAPYAGLMANPTEDVIVDMPGPYAGQRTSSNGSKRLSRVSGTSAAVAIYGAALSRKAATSDPNPP